MVTQASHPHIAFTLTLQLDSFPDVEPEREKCTLYYVFLVIYFHFVWNIVYFIIVHQPCSLDGFSAVYVTELAQTEPITT